MWSLVIFSHSSVGSRREMCRRTTFMMHFRRRFLQRKNETPPGVSRTLRSVCLRYDPPRRAPRWRRTPRSRSPRRSVGSRVQGACRRSSTREKVPQACTSCHTSRTPPALLLLTNRIKVRLQDIKD